MVTKGQATVVKHTGSHYMLSCLPQWNIFPAVLRGKIRLKGSAATNPVAVGDIVDFEAEIPEGDSDGMRSVIPAGGISIENPAVITAVHPRRNYVSGYMVFVRFGGFTRAFPVDKAKMLGIRMMERECAMRPRPRPFDGKEDTTNYDVFRKVPV